jgi:predicted YcjX-like family ATPase
MAEKLMSSPENLLSETIYTQYCSAFDQLIEVINNEPENVDNDKLEDMRLTLIALEQAFADEQEHIQDDIASERIKKRTRSAYLHSRLRDGYDKTT